MNLNLRMKDDAYTLQKRIFKETKNVEKDGLLLKLYNSGRFGNTVKLIRLLHASFNQNGHLLAVSDHSRNIFIIDIHLNKFWGFPTKISVSTLKFSDFGHYELVVGAHNGIVHVLHVETSKTLVELKGHAAPVINITFAYGHLCLTASKKDALIWDLKTFSKLQALKTGSQCLKHVLFIPTKNDILACFNDDTMMIWKYPNFECTEKVLPASWNKEKIKCIAFSRNGRVMVLGGYSFHLAVFLLDDMSNFKFVELPKYIITVRDIAFVSEPFDGGANRVLVILPRNGILYFYNVEHGYIYKKICEEQEIIKFSLSSDGEHIACILSNGHIKVYKVEPLLVIQEPTPPSEEVEKKQQSKKIFPFKLMDSEKARLEMQKILDRDKLKKILKVYGKYPETYRVEIWIQLLELPRNDEIYNGFINNVYKPCFPHIDSEYPLVNSTYLKNLKRLLSNLVTWSPFLKDVMYLPVFVFPFVKIFHNEPVVCFEAVCTIIINWCQYWFEYFPLPPVNVLSMVWNILVEHDSTLANHLVSNTSSRIYIWPLLESAFSEVLTSADWCTLWDHVLSNEPYFLLFCAASYNLIQRDTLLSLYGKDDFQYFFHNPNPVDIKKLISKAYKLQNDTSDQNHPKQYIYEFTKLEKGNYPKFMDPPNTVVMDSEEYEDLKRLQKEQKSMLSEERQLEDIIADTKKKLDSIEEERCISEQLKEIENCCKQEIQKEKKKIQAQRIRLEKKRMAVCEEELHLLDEFRKKMHQSNVEKKKGSFANILNELENNKCNEEVEIAKAEADLLRNYVSLMKHKVNIDEVFDAPIGPNPLENEKTKLDKLKEGFLKEIQKVQDVREKDFYRALYIATSREIIENLIKRVQVHLTTEETSYPREVDVCEFQRKVKELETAVKDSENDVNVILKDIAKVKDQKLVNQRKNNDQECYEVQQDQEKQFEKAKSCKKTRRGRPFPRILRRTLSRKAKSRKRSVIPKL